MFRFKLFIALVVCLSCAGCTYLPSHSEKTAFYLLEDATLSLEAEEAWQLFLNGKSRQVQGNSFNPGFSKSYFWLILKVPASEDPMILALGNAHINIIEFYRVTGDTVVHELTTGDHLPFSSRRYATAEFVFNLSTDGGYYLVKLDKVNESLQATFKTMPSSDFWAGINLEVSILSLITGIVVLLLVFGIFLGVITREKIYFIYIVYVALGWLWVLSNFGYGYMYLWPDIPWFASRARPVFAMLTLASSIYFIMNYVGVPSRQWQRRLFRLVIGMALTVTAIFLLPIAVLRSDITIYYLQFSVPSTTALFTFIVFYVLIAESLKGNRMAMFYFAGIALVLGFSAIQVAHYAGAVDFSETILDKYGMAIGYMFEAVVITFGMAYRFNTYRIEKERVLLKMNTLQEKHTQALISAQEAERRQIADQLHDVAGSLLSAAKLNLSSVRERALLNNAEANKKLETAEEAMTGVGTILRDLSHAISPIMLDKVGFIKSVERVVRIFNSSGKILVELDVTGFETEPASLKKQYVVLYGILYELLNNVVKHSMASHALVQIVEHEETIVLIVEDDGKGMIVNPIDEGESHGLAAIRSKIHYLKGNIELDCAGSKGLIVTIEIPKV